jgi:hypothetical protein
MSITPNSSELSRTADIKVSADELSASLSAIITDNPPAPVRMMLTKSGGMSVWTYDNAKTLQVLVDNKLLLGLKVKDDCVLLVEPKAFSELLSAKFAGQVVRIQTSANKPIVVKTKAGGQAVYHAADEDECHTVPDHWRLQKDSSGIYSFPMFENEPSTLIVKLSRSELQRGLVDMQVAKAPYVVFSFNEHMKRATCSSGHWGAKSNQSTSPIEADIIRGSGEVCFTSNLTTILKALDGDSILIQKHDKGTFVVLDAQTTSIVATEAIREA